MGAGSRLLYSTCLALLQSGAVLQCSKLLQQLGTAQNSWQRLPQGLSSSKLSAHKSVGADTLAAHNLSQARPRASLPGLF